MFHITQYSSLTSGPSGYPRASFNKRDNIVKTYQVNDPLKVNTDCTGLYILMVLRVVNEH